MKVAVLSDTHGLLREPVLKLVRTCDAVLHAGDLDSPEVMERLKTEKKPQAPFYAVRGNNDRGWAEALPYTLRFSLGGRRFLMTHRKKDVPEELGDREIVIYGHSHRFACDSVNGRLWLNPGSCGKRRFRLELTMAVLYLEEDGCRAERIEIPEEKEASGNPEADHTVEISAVHIQKIMDLMDKGQRVDRIAGKLGLEAELVEQICRIRVTHPGVSAQGIFDKMEAGGSV